MAKRGMTKLEAVCRVLCRQNGDNPNERVDYGKGYRWYDYHLEARAILRALAKTDTQAAA